MVRQDSETNAPGDYAPELVSNMTKLDLTSADRTGAPEITDEMYRAGSNALEEFYLGDGVYDLRKPCLMAVFQAMEAVRNEHAPKEPQNGLAARECSDPIVAILRS